MSVKTFNVHSISLNGVLYVSVADLILGLQETHPELAKELSRILALSQTRSTKGKTK